MAGRPSICCMSVTRLTVTSSARMLMIGNTTSSTDGLTWSREYAWPTAREISKLLNR